MSTIVKVRDKRTGITYAYSSVSYWDNDKKQGRSHRKLLGRVDETTGEIVPTSGRRGRLPKGNAKASEPGKPIDVKQSDSSSSTTKEALLRQELENKNNIIINQNKQIAELTIQLQTVQRAVSDFQATITKVFSKDK